MALRIRPASLADAAAIARLHLASYQAAYQEFLPAKFFSRLSAEDRKRRWQGSLNDPRRRVLVAEDDDPPGLIGFAEVGPSRDDEARTGTGELMALHVMQPRWRQGVGRMLHDGAVATLADQSFQAATLWVLTANRRARAFYEAMGWYHDGIARQHLVRRIEVAEVRYRIQCRGSEEGAIGSRLTVVQQRSTATQARYGHLEHPSAHTPGCTD
jgi:RimJ/RimL family protein N-acetyltransferase